jgi:hypothetical protein
LLEIVRFWKSRSLNGPPFVHPNDLPVLVQLTRNMTRPQKLDFRRFIASERFGAFDDHQFHFSLLPVPYAGDLANADIFVLLLNPGLSFSDYYGEWQVPEFRKRLKANLHQDFHGVEFHFSISIPNFAGIADSAGGNANFVMLLR